ncbi:hypothetical protein Bca52824_011842 [Brassica carinata]|uniref:RRM domain-containing protein n=1 Tax=Brassica carinata TaxID=52824 RepID=A0A8X7VVE3_BRACI|nr:hypothetical protein Bca52824_011842 [Brassica carinata]
MQNLDLSIDHKALHGKFSTFGNIVSCKVAVDASGQVKRLWGLWNTCRYAQKATEKLNGMLLNDKQVYVGSFLMRQ